MLLFYNVRQRIVYFVIAFTRDQLFILTICYSSITTNYKVVLIVLSKQLSLESTKTRIDF